MKKQALILGLTVALFSFVFLWIAGHIVVWLNLDIPSIVHLLILFALSYLTAFNLAPLVQGEDEPPRWVVPLLLFCAGYFILMMFLGGLNVSLGVGKFPNFLRDLSQWTFIASLLLTTRLLSRRMMLFVGLMAIGLQFNAGMFFGLLAMHVPALFLQLITLAVALWIARSLSLGEDSPADRVTKPLYLWLFSAASTLAMLVGKNSFLLGSIGDLLVWLSFLVFFVLTVSSIEPDDPYHQNSLGANYGLLFLVFVALFTVVGAVFHVTELAAGWIPFTVGGTGRFWLTMLATAVVAIGIMMFLQLGARIRPDGPGHRTLFWGVLLFFISVLAGGSIFGAVAGGGKVFDFLAAVYFIALLVVPIAVLAQILMGVGLLRILFTLDPPPRH